MDHDGARLDQRNLPERVAELLLSRVTAGALELGSRIPEVPLSKELGISRSTLREGLRLLEARGVVQSLPQKGTFVSRYDERSVGTVYATREALELRAFDHLMAEPKRLPGLIRQLDALVGAMYEHKDRGGPALKRLDIEFHSSIIYAADDFVMDSIWGAIKDHLTVIFSLEAARADDYPADHQEIIEALKKGNRAELVAKYQHHVSKGRLNVS